MTEINEQDTMVLTDVPKVLENEQIYVYIPVAANGKEGVIAVPVNSKDFAVENGKLVLKWDIDEKLLTKVDKPTNKYNAVFTVNDVGSVSYISYSSKPIVGNLSFPLRTINGDLIVLDNPKDSHAAVNQKYVDNLADNINQEFAQKRDKLNTPNQLYATGDYEDTGIGYNTNVSAGNLIPKADTTGNFEVAEPIKDNHVATRKFAERIFKEGGIIEKDLNVAGDLKVQGKLVYVTGTVEGLEKQYLELNTNKTIVIGTSGLLINKGKGESGDLGTYAIVYDAATDSVMCGLGKTRVDTIDGKSALVFEFDEGEGLPFALRDDASKMQDTYFIKWDAAAHKLVTSTKNEANVSIIVKLNGTALPVDETDHSVNIPYANSNNVGVIKTSGPLGIDNFGNDGRVYLVPLTDNEIVNRTTYKAIQTSTLNKAVKAALTDDKRIGTETTNPTTFTDEEKDRACEILGAVRPSEFKTLFGNQSITGSGNIDLYRHSVVFSSDDLAATMIYISSSNIQINSLTDLFNYCGGYGLMSAFGTWHGNYFINSVLPTTDGGWYAWAEAEANQLIRFTSTTNLTITDTVTTV